MRAIMNMFYYYALHYTSISKMRYNGARMELWVFTRMNSWHQIGPCSTWGACHCRHHLPQEASNA